MTCIYLRLGRLRFSLINLLLALHNNCESKGRPCDCLKAIAANVKILQQQKACLPPQTLTVNREHFLNSSSTQNNKQITIDVTRP